VLSEFVMKMLSCFVGFGTTSGLHLEAEARAPE
jgi:hypothetical protein